MWKNGDKVVALNSWDGGCYNKGVGVRNLCHPLDQDIVYEKGEVFTVDMDMHDSGKVCFKERRNGFTYNPANFTLLVGEAPIPVGTRVRIGNTGRIYTAYRDWNGHTLVQQRLGTGTYKWRAGDALVGYGADAGQTGVVIEFDKHCSVNRTLYAVALDNTNAYIVTDAISDGLVVLPAASIEEKAVNVEVATPAEQIRRQLQSRIDKRSNRIAAIEASVSQLEQLKKVSRSLTDTYWKNIAVDGRMRHLADQVCKLEVNSVDAQTLLTDWKQELKMLASEQSLDKRLMAVLINK